MGMDWESPYTPRQASILTVSDVTYREKLFVVSMSDGAPLGHLPGQFVGVTVPGVGEAPISVSSSPNGQDANFELCIRNAGSVTGALHRLRTGSTIGIRGPFGRGFPVDSLLGMDLLFVAGGLGLAPLRSMINYAVERRGEFGALTLLYGGRTPSDLMFSDELVRWSRVEDFTVVCTVDVADGEWTGGVGAITKLLDRAEIDPAKTAALVVGPPVMYRFVLKSMLTKGVYESRIYLSLERRMKCGLGKCGHCQIDDVYVCRKGPVFAYTRLRKMPEAI
jgi:sulfite reductase subunit B